MHPQPVEPSPAARHAEINPPWLMESEDTARADLWLAVGSAHDPLEAPGLLSWGLHEQLAQVQSQHKGVEVKLLVERDLVHLWTEGEGSDCGRLVSALAAALSIQKLTVNGSPFETSQEHRPSPEDLWMRLAYEGHPYAHSPDETVSMDGALTWTSFMREQLVSPRAHLRVTGPDPGRCAAPALEQIAALPEGPAPAYLGLLDRNPPPRHALQQGSGEEQLWIGWPLEPLNMLQRQQLHQLREAGAQVMRDALGCDDCVVVQEPSLPRHQEAMLWSIQGRIDPSQVGDLLDSIEARPSPDDAAAAPADEPVLRILRQHAEPWQLGAETLQGEPALDELWRPEALRALWRIPSKKAAAELQTALRAAMSGQRYPGEVIGLESVSREEEE